MLGKILNKLTIIKFYLFIITSNKILLLINYQYIF